METPCIGSGGDLESGSVLESIFVSILIIWINVNYLPPVGGYLLLPMQLGLAHTAQQFAADEIWQSLDGAVEPGYQHLLAATLDG